MAEDMEQAIDQNGDDSTTQGQESDSSDVSTAWMNKMCSFVTRLRG